ncbi:MAG: MFS transporter [Acidimicrobiia bacterium]|nr:MFS transporter [Acidimicrobiia bacterium]
MGAAAAAAPIPDIVSTRKGVNIESLRLIRRGSFARLWWSGTVSSLGDWVALFATIALANEIGGVTGIIVPLVGRLLPGIFGAVGGVVADRLDRKWTMVIADLGRGVLVLFLIVVDSLLELFVISFFLEVLTLIRQPAREASIPNLVTEEQLVTANSLSLVSAYGTFPLGSIGWSVAAKIGEWIPEASAIGSRNLAFIADAATFVISGVIVATMTLETPEVPDDRRGDHRFDFRAPWQDLKEGIRFVAKEKHVRVIILGMAAALFGGGSLFVLGQPFSVDALNAGDSGFGVLLTALGTGVGLGMLAVASFNISGLRYEMFFALSLIVTGVATMFTSVVDTVFGAGGWVFVVGLGAGGAYVMGFSALHEQVADEIRGRTFAALFTVVRTALLASVALAGVVAATIDGRLPGPLDDGIRAVLMIGGTIILLSGVLSVWTIRDLIKGQRLSPEAKRSLGDASEAFSSLRGRRRSNRDDK